MIRLKISIAGETQEAWFDDESKARKVMKMIPYAYVEKAYVEPNQYPADQHVCKYYIVVDVENKVLVNIAPVKDYWDSKPSYNGMDFWCAIDASHPALISAKENFEYASLVEYGLQEYQKFLKEEQK